RPLAILGALCATGTAASLEGGRRREAPSRPTGVWGYRAVRSPRSGRALTEPVRRRPPQQRGEAERESAHAGRRGLGASEERSARRARAADGLSGGRPSARALTPADGVWGHRRSAAPEG